jgi:subtilisin family serine protease
MRLAGVVLISIAVCALSAQAQVVPGLAERAAREGSVRVLVELAAPFTPEGRLDPAGRAAQRQAFAAARAPVAAALAGTAHRWRREFRTIPWAALEVDAAGLAALERAPGVVSVREDRLFRPSLDDTVPIVEGDLALAAGYDGTGQTIVVIDTGADADPIPGHPNLQGPLVGEACFASGANGPSGDCPNGGETDLTPGSGRHCTFHSDCFHGTHVAGIALGDGPQYDGVAVGAGLISIQVASLVTTSIFCGSDPRP